MKKALYSGILVLVLSVLVGFAGADSFSVVNKSGVNVTSISISPSGQNFSNAKTFSRSIGREQSISINFDASSENCSYDVKFSDDQGRVYIMSEISLCEVSEIVLERVVVDEVPAVKLK